LKKSTCFSFNNFFPESDALYVMTWEMTVQPDRTQMTI